MGYQEGQGIGAARQGQVTPLAVDLKATRAGLGVDEDRKRRRQQVQAQQSDRGTFRF